MGYKIKTFLKKIRIRRTTILLLVFLMMSFVLVRELFNLQIIQGQEYIHKFQTRTTKTRVIKSTRGNIYDRNGKVLASNVLSYSVTLEDNVTTVESAHAILLSLADSVSRHMRSDGAKAYGVSVSIRYLDFKTRSHQRKLEDPIDTTRAVYDTAKALLQELWKDQRPLRLIGISLTNLTREDTRQLSLFEADDSAHQRDARLDQAVDALRNRFGSEIIQRGTVMRSGVDVARKFKGKSDSEL